MAATSNSAPAIGRSAFESAAADFSSPIRLRKEAPPPPPPPPAPPIPDVAVQLPAKMRTAVSAPVPEHAPSMAEGSAAATTAPVLPPVSATVGNTASPPPPAEASLPPAPAAPHPATLSGPAPSSRARVDRALVKQAALGQTQVLRAIAHRGCAEMGEWEVCVGESQRGELLLYWGAWQEHIRRVAEANERASAYLRAVASATTSYASSLTLARHMLEPVASPEFLVQKGGASEGKGSGVKVSTPSLTHGRSPPPPSASLSRMSAALLDMHAGVGLALGELGAGAARAALGEAEGGHHPSRSKDKSSPPPVDLSSLSEWYTGEAGAVNEAGSTLAAALREASAACAAAFGEFDEATAQFLTGAGSGTGVGQRADLWLSELKFRRCGRALLAVKAIYLMAMAALFEKYRKIEDVRSECLATAFDSHAAALSTVFERVSAKGVGEAARSLHTHADFCTSVEAVARARILESRRAASSAAHAAPLPMVGGRGVGEAPVTVTAASYGAYSGGGGGAELPQSAHTAHRAHMASEHIHFTLDAAPPVITPFASPLIVRTGLLARQVGMLKTWKQHVAVLTRDCNLHLFALDVDKAASGQGISGGQSAAPPALVLGPGSDDLATHPDVLQAVYRPTMGGTAGQGGTALEQAASSAASAGEEEGRGKARAGTRLPPPALSPDLLTYASAYSTRVGDLLPSSLGGSVIVEGKAAVEHVMGLVRKAGSPPTLTIELTATTKLAFAPTAGAHVLEISDTKAGWFGASQTKQLLRATGAEDMLDWIVAANALVDVVVTAASS